MLRSRLAWFSSPLRDVTTRRVVEAKWIACGKNFSSAAGTCIIMHGLICLHNARAGVCFALSRVM